MPIKEGVSYSDESQAAFVARFEGGEGDRILVPEALFSATKEPVGAVSRIYSTPGFGFGIGALYRKDAQMPHVIIDALSKEYEVYINLPENDRPDLTLGLQHGKLTVRAIYDLRERENFPQLPQLEALVIEDRSGDPDRSPIVATTGFLPDLILTHPEDMDKILVSRGASYDQESGSVTLKYKDMMVRAKDKVPVEEILGRYFPSELRQDRLNAGIEHDVWAKSDWMTDFGIMWNRVVTTEIPVFSAS